MTKIYTDEAVLLWQDTVGDSGEAPTDDELATYANAIKVKVLKEILTEIESEILPTQHGKWAEVGENDYINQGLYVVEDFVGNWIREVETDD